MRLHKVASLHPIVVSIPFQTNENKIGASPVVALALTALAPDSRETQQRFPRRHVQWCHEEQLCRTKVLRHPHCYSLSCLDSGPSSPLILTQCPPKPGIQLPEFRDLRLYQRQGAWKYPRPPRLSGRGVSFQFQCQRGPRLSRWAVLLFASGRMNFSPPLLRSRNSVTPRFFVPTF